MVGAALQVLSSGTGPSSCPPYAGGSSQTSEPQTQTSRLTELRALQSFAATGPSKQARLLPEGGPWRLSGDCRSRRFKYIVSQTGVAAFPALKRVLQPSRVKKGQAFQPQAYWAQQKLSSTDIVCGLPTSRTLCGQEASCRNSSGADLCWLPCNLQVLPHNLP